YREQAKNQGLQNGISDRQRAAILQNYQAKMNTLQQVIEEKVIRCGCNIFVKSALVGRNTEVVDVTADIMKELDKRVPATAVVAAPVHQQVEKTIPKPMAEEGKGTPVTEEEMDR
ncbi:hypothetical protein QLK61_002220, partial [Neisseria gonorrhoeae]